MNEVAEVDSIIEVKIGSKTFESKRDVLATEERVNQGIDLLKKELTSILPQEEVNKRIQDLKKNIIFWDEKKFRGAYYDQKRREWDGGAVALTYEPRALLGNETERTIYILESGLEKTPEVLQMSLHEAIHFLRPATKKKDIKPWEIDEIIPNKHYLVSTIILEDQIGPVRFVIKNLMSATDCSRDDIENQILPGTIQRWNIIDCNVPIDELDEEFGLWEAITDWYALKLSKKAIPDYKPITGYLEREHVENFFNQTESKGLGEEFNEAIKKALFKGERQDLDNVLEKMGADYQSFKKDIVGEEPSSYH